MKGDTVNEDKTYRKIVSRLQPGRNDLLINGKWGIPLTELAEDEARKAGLVEWKYRWVTKEELRQLKPQYRTYMSIKWIAAIILFIGISVLVKAADFVDAAPSLPSSVRESVAFGSKFLYPVFHFVVAFGTSRYRNWARWVSVILFPFLIPPRTFYESQTDEIFKWYMLILCFFILMLVTFFSRTGRVIFKESRR